MKPIAEMVYRDWRQFKTDWMYDLFGSNSYHRGVFLFRGHRDPSWNLETSFDRWFKKLEHSANLDRVKTSERLLAQFISECEGLESVQPILNDQAKMLALGQHYGLPTRILDWSENPYAATFFAFSELISHGEDNDQIAIWALNLRNKIWNAEFGVEIIDVPSISNVRLRNQSGKFTFSRTPFSCLEDYVKNSNCEEVALTKILLPANDVKIVLADLDSMGINHSWIYPELTGRALAAQVRVLLDF